MHIALHPFESARTLAEKGCSTLAEAPDRIRKLRSLGEMAWSVGGRRLRRTVGARLGEVRRNAGGWSERIAGNGYAPAAGFPPAPAPPGPAMAPGTAAALAIPDYDELSASQVVSRLGGLARGELEAVGAYEQANRARKTVLGAVTRHLA